MTECWMTKLYLVNLSIAEDDIQCAKVPKFMSTQKIPS